MKHILLLLILGTSVFALSINDSLLKIHAVLVPKIYLMDYKFKDKLKNNTIKVAIVYKSNQYKDAKRLEALIQEKYKNGIKNYKVKAVLVSYKEVVAKQANVYYLFPAKTQDIKKVVKIAAVDNALTFSYLRDDLKHGVMISLNVSTKIKPLLNLKAIQTYNIRFRPVLINISSIYINELGSVLEHINIRGFLFHKVYQA